MTFAWVLFGAMALAQVLVPLTDDDTRLTSVVVVLFAALTTALAARVWGWRRALVAGAVVVGGTTVLERVGTSTGWPFGEYRYTGALSPTISGVPLAVVLAWWAMAAPAREVAARLVPAGWRRVAVGALALTAWDVVLDPQMVGEGYWVWDGGGPWRDVPLSNYAGWLAASLVVMAALDRLLPDPPGALPLVALYAWWTVMSAVGFLFFFGDPLVGLVGGLSMGAFAYPALRRPVAAAPAAGRRG